MFHHYQGVDWSVDNFQAAQAKGFVVDVPKGSVDADSSKILKIQWNPLEDHDVSLVISESSHLCDNESPSDESFSLASVEQKMHWFCPRPFVVAGVQLYIYLCSSLCQWP